MQNTEKVQGTALLQENKEVVKEPVTKETTEDTNTTVDISPEIIKITSPMEVLDIPSKKVRIAILSEEGFEEVELTEPKDQLESAGAKVDVISPHNIKIRSWNQTNWGKEVNVDISLMDAHFEDYDALVLPGGVMNPDKLRQNKKAIDFIRQMITAGKTVAAICHGPQLLIETGLIAGVTMTSFPSLQTDLKNAGANWVDQEMVHSGQFITSRKPADLHAFISELMSVLSLQRRT